MMTVKRYKNIPKGFRYPISKKEIRKCVAGFEDCLINVEFDGVKRKKSKWEQELFPYYFHHLIHLKASRSDENYWTFTVSITAQKHEYLGKDRRATSRYLLSSIQVWIASKMSRPAHGSPGELHALISFRICKKTRELLLDE